MKPIRIAVVGDIMIDIDLFCQSHRGCQEGEWPVLSVERTEKRLGGSGNVAEMVSALGAEAHLFGLGCIESIVQHRCDSWSVVPSATPTKARLHIGGKLTGPRIDHDVIEEPVPAIVSQWKNMLLFLKPDAIIVCDHGKGVVSKPVMEMLASTEIPLFIDPVNTTPLIDGCEPSAIIAHSHELPKMAYAQCMIIKSGKNGLSWSNGSVAETIPTACRNLVDPLGAGDQFIAAFTYQICQGASWRRAVRFANILAGMQCERRGCVPITSEDIAQHGVEACMAESAQN